VLDSTHASLHDAHDEIIFIVSLFIVLDRYMSSVICLPSLCNTVAQELVFFSILWSFRTRCPD